MQAIVVIATKGRAAHVHELLSWLQRQTVVPAQTFVVGSEPKDVEGLDTHPSTLAGEATILVAGAAGSSLQRNLGVKHARDRGFLVGASTFCVFMDDDYRPADTWIEQARNCFLSHPDVVGITGHVLADGVHGLPISSAEAAEFISGKRPPNQHWASGDVARDMDCLYGCNMAFRGDAMQTCEFDECLPLYGWQEDQDYSAQITRHGRLIYLPDCKGVHMGSTSGRTSGLRLGYSQIVNPIYLVRKGTMSKQKAQRFIARHLVANVVKSFLIHHRIDYRGRLRGNLRALKDLSMGVCDPRKITTF
jgi:GT2 family glycosyltransferase